MRRKQTAEKVNLKRIRYQQGSLNIEQRKSSPDVWVYRWRENNADGRRVKRKQIVGTKSDFPSKAAAMRAIDGLRLEINSATTSVSSTPLTVAELAKHYVLVELGDDAPKTQRTKAVYRQQLDSLIIPKWGMDRIGNIKAFMVEAWLKKLPHAPGTKAKTRNVMSVLYQHAVRMGWAESNPIRAVRQSSKRKQEPDILTPEEVTTLLSELAEPSRTIVLIAATTGLRRGELFGLKWSDVDFEKNQLRIVRSIVDQVEGETKTAGSKRPLPMPPEVAASLVSWRATTPYKRDEDWIFASPQASGRRPLWPGTNLVRNVKPAAVRAGITKNVGWHTFRRTFATLLQSSGATVKTAQELMRHASPVMTLGVYAQAVTEDKRDAQAVVAGLFKADSTTEPSAA